VAFVREAKRVRKLLGGGMRQSGILAAAGLHVLDEEGLPRTLEEIARSHRMAQRLATVLAELDAVRDPFDAGAPFDPHGVRTNILRFGLAGDPSALLAALAQEGIGALPYHDSIRMVTHRGVTDTDVERVVTTLRDHLA
jgi:threonine aldolase